MIRSLPAALGAAAIAFASSAAAHEGPHAADHAPIGVMGDHTHKKNEFMVSYRFMRMAMEGLAIGTDDATPEEIVTTIPNRFFGAPGQPPTLRVVPTNMTMDMHMGGVMYAPTDRLTLMAMGSYVIKDMDHVTFMGGMGATVLGEFTTRSTGFGDTKLSALYSLVERPGMQLILNAGLSLPTGSITRRDDVLAPTGMTPNLRLPYPMQLGTGTFDLEPGLTFRAGERTLTFGAQYKAAFRLGDNDEGYSFGDKHSLTAWAAYEPKPWISFSARLAGVTQGSINGIDPTIIAPVQTADPDNFGGDRIDAGVGVNLLSTGGALKGHRIAAELMLPIYQDLNGPQLKTDWTLTIGWQKAF